MGKAILVMDMPKSCSECSICASWQESAFSAREYWCPVMQNKDVEPNKRPDWCPLKKIPRKLEREIVKEDYNGGYSHGIVHGYNGCIDDILKGSEENG